jgi:hypothetical protein
MARFYGSESKSAEERDKAVFFCFQQIKENFLKVYWLSSPKVF